MIPRFVRALVVPLALAAAAAPAGASAFSLFQHGGRATAQAGAFVARASDPSAVRYNPAAIARLEGFQLEAGLDFQAPSEDFDARFRTDSPEHVIQFPPAVYASWKPSAESRLAYGLSLDSPFWSIENWNTALFPGRFDTSRQELTLFEIRPTVAWAIDDRWSVGGSVRYVSGALETFWSTIETFPTAGLVEQGEVLAEAETSVDGIGIDLAAHYAADGWGFGVVASSGVSLDGDGDLDFFLRDPLFTAAGDAQFAARFGSTGVKSDFELPPSLTVGGWWSLFDGLDIEADVAWNAWSALDRTRLRVDENPYLGGDPPALDRRRDWQDTLSLRAGAELALNETFSLGTGLAWEPSPVPSSTLEPGFARGDAWALAFGGTFTSGGLSIDLGYSYFLYADGDATFHDAGTGTAVRGTFSGRSQVWAVSARWRM